ncbi:unnamed protein product [Blepharisma stoltei]|uniref:Uncharacterized protein n=1 Tax=Blepharisma stoltei TaxID=1481888 RepID=A0AAU9JCZ3_9CILI|nr:unnamed protein product [Blepharisma stoltei]
MINIEGSSKDFSNNATLAMENILENMFSLINPKGKETEFNLSETKDLPLINFSKVWEIDNLYPLQNQSVDCHIPDREERVCTHTDRKVYARNMCNHCYRTFGQNKMAWTCPHKDRQHYAKGRCQLCYLKEYHRSRVFGKRRKSKGKYKIN